METTVPYEMNLHAASAVSLCFFGDGEVHGGYGENVCRARTRGAAGDGMGELHDVERRTFFFKGLARSCAIN